MKFQVEFLLGFFGHGSVYVDEMALVLEGRRPKFYVPLLNLFYHRVVEETATVTVPYSRIIKVKRSRDDLVVFMGIMSSLVGFILLLIGDVDTIRKMGPVATQSIHVANMAAVVIWLISSYIGGPYRSITYRDFDGGQKTVVLRFIKPRKENASTFTARVEEFLAVTRPFTEDKRV